MASKKSKLLEQALQEEIHPFAARKLNTQEQQNQQVSPTQPEATTSSKKGGFLDVNEPPEEIPVFFQKDENQSNENKQTNKPTVVPRHHDTMVSHNDDSLIETIRKAVKHLGKEAATYRFTQEEKKALSDIVYTYKGRGVKTSENEITRTAINFLVEDYHQNGDNSILARVLERLNE